MNLKTGALTFAVAIVAVGLVSAKKHDSSTASSDDTIFTQKLVGVQVPLPISGAVVQNPRIKRIAGRAFLVGESINLPGAAEEVPEMTYWFPVEDIEIVREFKSVEDADEVVNGQ